jgi:DNA-binding NarL/FixJ family response regulator
MLTVDDYGAIRRARRDGKSIRQIAREFDHSRNTIRKILNQAEPNPGSPALLVQTLRIILNGYGYLSSELNGV